MSASCTKRVHIRYTRRRWLVDQMRKITIKSLSVCSETCKSKDAQKGKDPCVGARRILTSSVRQSPRLQRTEPITEVTYFSHFHGNFHVCFDRKFLKAEKISSERKENDLQYLQQDERMSNDRRPRLFKVVSITL